MNFNHLPYLMMINTLWKQILLQEYTENKSGTFIKSVSKIIIIKNSNIP